MLEVGLGLGLGLVLVIELAWLRHRLVLVFSKTVNSSLFNFELGKALFCKWLSQNRVQV